MKAIFIAKNKVREIDLIDLNLDEEFFKLMHEYKLLESHVIYFSAGESKIKEILVKQEPTYSA
ncbi:MAG TPA: hypothetical protein PKM65_15360 [Spirochaetota bacterium]|nr:hypothetical protein [Spirochaetota bacterium]HNT10387.1 hypothetical protein [Spirochaetota bacterium]HOS40403.1 hypothetical protein [Spirochaetota bacterium]HPU89211.1 hypothetical protein [Spirochaetota bacterium]